jgi:hypothetical protein
VPGAEALGWLRASAGRNSVLIASASTLVFLAVLVGLSLLAPGRDKVLEAFVSPHHFGGSFGMVWDGFQTSVKLMMAAQAIVLVFALLIAEHHRSGPPVGAAFVYGVRPLRKRAKG